MASIKGLLAVLFWTVSVNGERWYSAAIVESDQYGAPTHLTTNYLQDIDHRLMPMTAVKQQNFTERNMWQVMKKPEFTYRPLIRVSNRDTGKSKYGSVATEMNEMHANAGKKPPAFLKYNNTIKNINVIKAYPKRKIVRKRCPTLRPTKPRQKKQLNLNQTAEPRFLEVFEVVEFHHVACSSSSGLEGICLPEYDCLGSGGTPMGTCADGYGTCCVTQFSCDDLTAAPSGWFTNPGFPSPSTERLSCALTLDKTSSAIRQIRLDFNSFELLPPTDGSCEQDQFVVSGQDVNNIIPILCGVNSGQHVYIDVGNAEGPIILSVQSVSSESRLFSIKVALWVCYWAVTCASVAPSRPTAELQWWFRITQLTAADGLAPSGCLQYFNGAQGVLESFNYRDKSDIAIPRIPSYLNNLNYAMCIERTPTTCSVTYTNTGYFQIVNYDADGLPVIPPQQAGVEIFNCPTDWLLMAAVRLCGDRLNDGSVLQDFALDAPVTDVAAGPMVVWFRSDGGYVGRGFKLQYQQNNC